MDRIAVFRACFSGLKHVYGTYDPSTGRHRKGEGPVTDEVILRHLNGDQPYGVYLLDGATTAAAVADFDEDDAGPPLRFVRLAHGRGVPVYIERSKSKGWHVWVFFAAKGVIAAKARRALAAMLNELDLPRIEIFPKQDCLTGNCNFGNFVNAPLFGRLVPQGRTVFVDPENGLRVISDQWSLLESVQRVPESALDALCAASDPQPRSESQPRPSNERPTHSSCRVPNMGLPPCARRMLAEGVSHYQRVACFRLAVQLRKTRLSQEAALAWLRAWASKNRPADGKKIITDSEIVRQTASAYASSYRSCGCEDPAVSPYCDPSCGIRLRSATTSLDSNQTNASNPRKQENHHVAHDTNGHS
jgi:hypothetical protein